MLARIAGHIGPVPRDGAALIAVDGVDGSGKTTFAQALVEHLEGSGQRAVRVSIDSFHRPRADRYRRGRDSAEGFYRDSFDLEAFRTAVVEPVRPGGDLRVTPAVFDHRSDSPVRAEPLDAAGTVVVVDGVFLQSPALADVWDLAVFLEVPFAETFARMAVRDGCPADPDHPANARYRDGQLLYLTETDPAARADLVVDNADPENPVVRRAGRGRGRMKA